MSGSIGNGISLQASFAAAPEKHLGDVFGRLVQEIELPGDLLHTPGGGRAVAHGRIGNPSPVPLTISYEAVIRAYGREIAVAYARKGESGRYQIQDDDGSAHD